eukprot:NODE_1951_length_1241_cov_171.628356_g1619_i0.p1 GENE.NODE_1951_length_1241_cov_171.628356_g1619_i0~~NODE_1951_length_1241_cov_171.628356_g1619_i0.p1  ORF type:complete len:331 (+),score=76.91 NODE_1951_length_1241_cov_171.628356_g1619_i0:77-1069(+)
MMGENLSPSNSPSPKTNLPRLDRSARVTSAPPSRGHAGLAASDGAAARHPAGGREDILALSDPIKSLKGTGLGIPQHLKSGSECSVCCGDNPECICTVCICGCHRCPPVTNTKPFNGLSEYQKKFKPWEAGGDRYRRKPGKPLHTKAAPGAWNTSNSMVPHPPQARAQREKDTANPRLPFDGTSHYRDSFIPKEIEEKSPKDRKKADAQLPFDGTTEQRKAFQGFNGKPADPCSPPNKPLDATPFLGTTENRDEFQGRPTELERRKKDKESWEYGPPRDLNSSYRDNYDGKTGYLCPARLLKSKKHAHDGHLHFHFTGQYNTLGDPLYSA